MRGVTLFPTDSSENSSSPDPLASSSSGWSKEVLLACDACLTTWTLSEDGTKRYLYSFPCESEMAGDIFENGIKKGPCVRMRQRAMLVANERFPAELRLSDLEEFTIPAQSFFKPAACEKVVAQNITDLKADIDKIITPLKERLYDVSDNERISICLDALKKSELCRLLWSEDKNFESLHKLWKALRPNRFNRGVEGHKYELSPEVKKKLVIKQLEEVKDNAETFLNEKYIKASNPISEQYLRYHSKLRYIYLKVLNIVIGPRESEQAASLGPWIYTATLADAGKTVNSRRRKKLNHPIERESTETLNQPIDRESRETLNQPIDRERRETLNQPIDKKRILQAFTNRSEDDWTIQFEKALQLPSRDTEDEDWSLVSGRQSLVKDDHLSESQA